MLKNILNLRIIPRLRNQNILSRCFGIQYQNYFSSQTQSSQSDFKNIFKEGSQISGFLVERIENIAEIQLSAIYLKHVKTGANYLHIARDDPNNVFCIGFRTTPMDSTGVAHILEHNVLCGSQKFPCRDPFFKMLNRSLSTFMNAMTGSDYTIYPFSTQNAVDYKNLMSIYLDAVFSPNLRELDFLQEGWRLEHENTTDRNSSIVFKGVVFNEMKGVFADSQNLFMQKLQNGLLPSHTYSHVSGGEPLHIPCLTWEQLQEFHKTHYHPSNSRIFSYGDLPLEDHLEFINKEYLSNFECSNPDTSVPSEIRWKSPRRDHIECSSDPMVAPNCQNSVAISYMLTDIGNDFENFILSIISELLISGPNAPFYKSLIEPQLGSGYLPSVGFDHHTRNTTFTVGLQGVGDGKIKEVETAIAETFDRVISEGFPNVRIEAILHSIELSLKHQTSNFGLGLAMNLTPLWNHGGDIVSTLKINSKIERFRQLQKENPSFIVDRINTYFINNQHKYTLTMSPSTDYESKLVEGESNLLKDKITSLSEEEKSRIWELGNTLKTKQEMKEDISCLPTLKVSDISRNIKPSNITQINELSQVCVQPTNGVSYFNAFINTKNIPQDLIKFIPLFCNLLTSMGASDLDFRALSQRAELISGGLGSNFIISNHPQDASLYEEGIQFSSFCLQKNFGSMLDLWSKIINELRLDDESRFSTLLNMLYTDQANGLVHNGHSYAMSFASSTTNYASHIKENSGGLTQLLLLKDFCSSQIKSDILLNMKRLYEALQRENNIRFAINSSPEHVDETSLLVDKFSQNISVKNSSENIFSSIPSNFNLHSNRTHHVFSFPVNFCAKSYNNVPYSHPDSGPLRVLARLMFQFLHREIREKGGAYGGGAVAAPGGSFSFFSYRDPHSIQTLRTFDEAVQWVISGSFDQRDVDEAKLGVFQKLDGPVPPGSMGIRQFINHITDEMHHNHRMSVVDATAEDLIRVCQTYLNANNHHGTCIIGPQNDTIQKDSNWHSVSHSI